MTPFYFNTVRCDQSGEQKIARFRTHDLTSCRTGGYVCCTDFVVCGEHIIRDAIVCAAFATDNVRLNADHIRYLNNHPQLECIRLCIEGGGFPLAPAIYRSKFYYGVWRRTV